MLNMPVLKFEKSCNYLKDQLQIQENNKQLLLDIIGNIGLISNDSSSKDKENYDSILESANELLQTASSNIKTLEHLNLEISSITKELTELLSDKNRSTKSKEFYIAAFSGLKNSITQYTEKFKNIETKLVVDTEDFNTFIRENNLKYTFDSIEIQLDGSTKTNYQFTGFSFNDGNAIPEITKLPETVSASLSKEDAEKNKKINALTNEFKNLLVGLSADSLTNVDLTSFLSSYVTQLSNENIEVKETITGARKDDLTEIIGFVKDSVQEELTQALDETIEPTSVTEDVLEEVTAEIELEEIPDEVAEQLNAQPTVNELVQKEEPVTTTTVTTAPAPSTSTYQKASIEANIFDEYELFDTSSLTKFKPLPKTTTAKTEEIFSSVSTTTAKETTSTSFTNVVSKTLEEEIDELEEFEENENIEDVEDVEDIELTAEDLLSYDISDEELNSITISEDSEDEENLLDELLLESIIEEDFKIESEPVKPIQKIEIQKPTITIEEKIELIEKAESDNETLIISERTNSIYLPYKVSELIRYIETYPNVYSSLSDVVEQEFILPFDYFMKHPFKSRFFETYNLIRNRQGKPVTHAVKAGLKLIYKHNLNPAIIAACKSEHELNTYLYYLDNKNLKGFKFFNIHYDINPL